jgi:hypothetical protein
MQESYFQIGGLKSRLKLQSVRMEYFDECFECRPSSAS